MPTYDFECPKCSSRVEKRRSFSDNSPVPCPECGTETELVISAVPIIFKGSGFYVTDHRGNHGHSAPVEGSDSGSKANDSAKTIADSNMKTESKAKAESKAED